MKQQTKKGGFALLILKGQYEGKKAIAMRDNQTDNFINNGKLAVTVFADDYQTKLAENVLISINNMKQIGFID